MPAGRSQTRAQQPGTYAVCKSCQRWRWHTAIWKNACACGQAWPAAELTRARQAQKPKPQAGQQVTISSAAPTPEAAPARTSPATTEAALDMLKELSSKGLVSGLAGLVWTQPPAEPKPPAAKLEVQCSKDFRKAMVAANKAQEALGRSRNRVSELNDSLEKAHLTLDADEAAAALAVSVLNEALEALKRARAATIAEEAAQQQEQNLAAAAEAARPIDDPDKVSARKRKAALPAPGELEKTAWDDYHQATLMGIKGNMDEEYFTKSRQRLAAALLAAKEVEVLAHAREQAEKAAQAEKEAPADIQPAPLGSAMDLGTSLKRAAQDEAEVPVPAGDEDEFVDDAPAPPAEDDMVDDIEATIDPVKAEQAVKRLRRGIEEQGHTRGRSSSPLSKALAPLRDPSPPPASSAQEPSGSGLRG